VVDVDRPGAQRLEQPARAGAHLAQIVVVADAAEDDVGRGGREGRRRGSLAGKLRQPALAGGR